MGHSMAYHEIEGSRSYDYRYIDGDYFTGWTHAGAATPETLASILAGLPDVEYEVREVCAVADDAGGFSGHLIFTKLAAAALREVIYRQPEGGVITLRSGESFSIPIPNK